MVRSTTAAKPLAWAYAALILYASLYPFIDWRWPPGVDLVDLLRLSWPPWLDPFDLWANVLGYVPMGAVLILAADPRRGSTWSALGVGVALVALGSYAIEVLQTFLPGRHPSAKDWASNTVGAAAGALMAAAWRGLGLAQRWRGRHERWFVPHSGGARALLVLWPFALLSPTPLPLGLGQVGERLREMAAESIDGVTWARPFQDWLQPSYPALDPLLPFSEGLAIALGLFGPCMLCYVVARRGMHRLLLSLVGAGVAVGTMTLSAALNYGPQHAAGWLTATTPPALVGALLTAWACAAVPRRVACGLALVALAGSVVLVAQAPSDPYLAQNLQAWEHGRWVRFYGVTLWVGLLWPYLALLWLLRRLAQRDDEPD